jgi:ABC-type proline/glycine betaine transport system substrate-binding protein
MKTYSANSMISVAMALSVTAAFAAALMVAFLVMGAPARGQAPAPPAEAPTVPAQPKINLTLEQRHVIKEIIKDLNVSPAAQKIETTVGTTVPATINLSPMPQVVAEKVPQVKSHMFFIESGKVVIVDPKENKIVDAID